MTLKIDVTDIDPTYGLFGGATQGYVLDLATMMEYLTS
jgi:hypothetical protein